jgi:hypothetical protein
MIFFDHIEIHVRNSNKYVTFLELLFKGGRYKRISNNNTYMFLTNDNLRFEIKESLNHKSNIDILESIGFCLPCLRMKNCLGHLESLENIVFTKKIDNPDGSCIFFKDYEGIDWHFKDYDVLDIYTNI